MMKICRVDCINEPVYIMREGGEALGPLNVGARLVKEIVIQVVGVV